MDLLDPGAGEAHSSDLPAPLSARDAPPDPAREAVVRLSRAVQRAAIYPADHPAVRLALGPFLDVLHGLAQEHRRLLLVVMRDRLVASAGQEPPREHQSRWLASQLFGRRITSLTFDARLDAEELQGFVRWLSQSAREQQGPPPELPAGVGITQLDYSRAQFDEAPRPRGTAPDQAIAAWNALAVGLLAPGVTIPGCADAAGNTASLEPASIARAIQADLAAAEGTGVSAVTGRLIKAGGALATLPDAERQVVRDRLAGVVAALPDEIRRQILALVPDDNPGKIDLLIEILDALPQDRILELVPRIGMTPGTHARQFLTFLVKLISLAGGDAAVGDAVEAQLSRHGLPAELLHVDPEGTQRLLDQLFTQTVEHFSTTGELYRASLQDLCVEDALEAPGFDLSQYGRPENREDAARHVGRVALHLLRTAPRDASAAACLIRARDVAQRDLDAGDIDVLAELSVVVKPVLSAPLDATTLRLAQECHALCREPRAADRLMAALQAHVGPASEELIELFLASGLAGATLALERIGELPDGPFRDRLGHLIARLDLDVVRPAIARVCADGVSVSRLLGVFRQVDPARTGDLARLFIRDTNPAVRRQALEALSDAPLAPVKRERVMVRALSDDDPGVVRVALRELSAQQSPLALAALTDFLSRTHGTSLETLQRYAVQALRLAWTPKVTEALVLALLARRRAFDPAARRVSRAIVAVLEAAGGAQAQAGVRTWRRSPAGVWSACRGDHIGVAS